MITTDFSNYILTKSERKLLKKIKRGKVAVYRDDFQDLLNQNFICYQQHEIDEIENRIPKGDKIMITEYGKAYLKWKKRDNIRFWFPVVISVIALIISAVTIA